VGMIYFFGSRCGKPCESENLGDQPVALIR
jgi:hypothetical protein